MATQYPEGFEPIQQASYPEGFQPIDSTPKGQVIVNPSPLTGHQGELVIQSQPLAALSRGILNSILAGTPEAAASLAGANPAYDPSSPQFTNPLTFSLAETLGSLIPIGKVASGAKTLGQLALRGARAGGVYGFGQGVSQAASQEQPTVGQALESGTLSGLGGAAIGAAIPGVAAIPGALSNAASRLSKSLTPASVEQKAMAALDFTKEEVNQHIPIVTQRVSQLVGETPKTTQGAIKAIDNAKSQLYNERLEVNNAGTQLGLVAKGDQAIQAASDTLDSIPNLLPAEKEAIINDLQKRYGGDKSLDEGQAIQQRLNKEFEAQFDNGTFDKAAPSNEAKLAIRNSFADQMDEVNKAVTGRDETPYADIGSLIQVKGALQDKLNKIEGREAAKKTGIEASPSSVPTTKFQATMKAKKSILSPFQKTQLEKLDSSVQSIFENSPRQEEPQLLQQQIVNSLRSQYSPATLPSAPPAAGSGLPRILPAAPVAPTPSTLPGQFNAPTASVTSLLPADINTALEQSIKDIEKQYPGISPDMINQILKASIQNKSKKPRALTSETINRISP